jgi:hypothetical protein
VSLEWKGRHFKGREQLNVTNAADKMSDLTRML